MVTNSILPVITKVCSYLDNIRYVDIISVADRVLTALGAKDCNERACS